MVRPSGIWSHGAMEDTTTQKVIDVEASEETSESTETPKRLERVEEGRWIAGVATGFAEYLHLPVWFTRVLLLLTLTAGGSGILIYVALAVLIPHEADDESLVQQWFGPKQSNPTKEA
jgi:phage shock protein PspC (stress-responsive transcriptional regulator)